MPSSPQPVEMKDPGHALVTPGHAPSQQPVPPRPGRAPVDATLAYPALKKIRTLSIDAELTLMTLFGQRQSSTMPPLKLGRMTSARWRASRSCSMSTSRFHANPWRRLDSPRCGFNTYIHTCTPP